MALIGHIHVRANISPSIDGQECMCVFVCMDLAIICKTAKHSEYVCILYCRSADTGMRVCMEACVCVCARVCTSKHVFARVHECVYVCVRIEAYMCTHRSMCARLHINVCMCMCVCVCV